MLIQKSSFAEVYLHILCHTVLGEKTYQGGRAELKLRHDFFSSPPLELRHTLHCNKSFAIFLSPAGLSLTKLSLAGNNVLIPCPRKVWSKKIQESRKFVYSVACEQAGWGREGEDRVISYDSQKRHCPRYLFLFHE